MNNPFLKSNKFDELIDIYKDIASNGCFYENGQFCPPEKVFGKSGQIKFKDLLKSFFIKNKIQTLLDYGGGQGTWNQEIQKGITLKDHLKLKDILIFEPARNLNQKKFLDCVVSFDVLEHVFISDVPWVIFDIFSHAKKAVFINVASFKASKKITKDDNAHITIRPHHWWKGTIDTVAHLFPKIHYQLVVSIEPKKIFVYETASVNEQLNINGYTSLNK